MVTRQIEESERNIAKCKNEIVNIMADESKVKSNITKLSADLTNYHARLRRLGVEQDNTLKEKGEIENRISEVFSAVNCATESVKQLRSKISITESDFNCQREALESLNATGQNLKGQVLSLESQLKFLENLKSQYEEIPLSVKALLLFNTPPEGEMRVVLGKKIDSSTEIDSQAKSTLVNF